ncbi:PQQ-binding-like beta-propeller repeat protein [Actinocorallia longicatena]|uniref:PQQ-binding-like beta-propeller repeat protein n=1 Tax=Actinocorallia longicatena TaxID=111803 RepID=A0ABP6Q736_9ACTN
MPSAAHKRLLSALVPALLVAGCSSGPGKDDARAAVGWADTAVNAVSKPVTGGGVTAVTGYKADGTLETAVYDVTSGKRLWAQPATMVGRLTGMGVQPPAVTDSLVVALEPQKTGKWNATLVARDAKTGTQQWTRPVDSTFGPVRCGVNVCMSEFTARKNARFVALDGATGEQLWKIPGIAEVEHADADQVVVFRMAKHPTLESRAAATGKGRWTYPVEKAVGTGVNLSGGWSFGRSGDLMLGYVAPYQAKKGKKLSAYGFFAVRLATGARVWARPKLLRVYPSASPAVSLITRQMLPNGGYGGFAQLDPATGRTTVEVPAVTPPKDAAWWLSFPADLSSIGFLSRDRAGTAFDLKSAKPADVKELRTWSFCTVDPAELKIKGQPAGFYPVAALCPYDLAAGRRSTKIGPPPSWYTGSVDGWRVWRDEKGALHGLKDAKGTSPGMYGS